MTGGVLVRGDGVAAVCCVRSLAGRDLPLHLERTARPKLAALLLSESTQSLLTDLFADTDLFSGFPRIRKRVVAWGPGAEPLVLPHSALVIPEKDLIERLWNRVPNPNEGVPDVGGWEIVSSRMESPAVEEKHFGTRSALVAEVQLKASADRESCWAESLEDGWLFLFPLRANSACLIAVGEHEDSLLGQSRLIATQIETSAPAAKKVAASPRILSPLCGDGWLACGTAAMAFDPICGEGAAHAVREAILASAVVRAAIQGGDRKSLLAHYNSRLMLGFLRHLQICQSFYASGGAGPFWSGERELLNQGINWLQQQVQTQGASGFRLVGFELLPV
jgi:hypothetical protein